MALTERKEVDLTVKNDGRLEVREDTIIERDGVVISRIPHRKVIDVGDDVINEQPMVKEIASIIHTPERISARNFVKKAEQDKSEQKK
jgi:hypothetical protein